MQFTKTLADVRDQVAADDCGKWDTIVPRRQITLHRGRLTFPQATSDGYDQGLTLTPWATAQLCQWLGLPAAYVKRCPPDLQDANVNYWLRTGEIGGRNDPDPDPEWLLRAKGATVRAVLSPKYSRLDNAQLLSALLPVLTGTRYEIGLVQLTPESFHLRLVDPTLFRDVVPGDRLMVGIHLANSEVGLRAVTVDALVFRLACANGLIRRVSGQSLLRQRHLHVSEPRFTGMLEAGVRQAVMVAAGFLEQVALAVRTPVPDVEAAIGTLAERWDLPRQTEEHIRFALLGEARPETLYGLVNAITLAAQRLPVEERFELETQAGMLIDTTSVSPSHQQLRARLLAGSRYDHPEIA
jgi:hypothetical protein